MNVSCCLLLQYLADRLLNIFIFEKKCLNIDSPNIARNYNGFLINLCWIMFAQYIEMEYWNSLLKKYTSEYKKNVRVNIKEKSFKLFKKIKNYTIK